MEKLLVFAGVGLLAQLVDGSLGMAYGVTSTTLLLATGVTPAVASASVHLSEVGTTLASGLSHWRFGNVDWAVVVRIAVPGAIGGFAGANLLTHLSTEAAVPWMAVVLLVLGLYVIARFVFARPPRPRRGQRPSVRALAPLGLFAGFVDATGGGGWGPVATPTLLASGKLDPRKVIGSVSTAEFAVTLAISAGFLTALGHEAIDWRVVAGLLVGGVFAAPAAAYMVRHVSLPMLGALVGGLILVTNSRTLLRTFDAESVLPYAVLGTVWLVLIALAAQRTRAQRREERDKQSQAQPADAR